MTTEVVYLRLIPHAHSNYFKWFYNSIDAE